MTNYQTREAARIGEDRQDRHAEQTWRAQLLQDAAAREIRAENFRRVELAS